MDGMLQFPAIPCPVSGLRGRGVTHFQALLGHMQNQRVPKPPLGNTLGTSILLKGGCSSGGQSTRGWETACSADLQPLFSLLPGRSGLPGPACCCPWAVLGLFSAGIR